MAWGFSGARRGLRYWLLGLAPIATALAHAEGYSPPSASIVVDGSSGAVLQASNPDAQRHPASLTKIMTLYLLFERLEAGKIKLDSSLKVSERASEQAPTKLGLKPGQTIAVEDAIKAIVTKSANDAAVAVAENLGGDESRFAKLMTQKARDLGMTRTTYTNASGLPDDDQITTARDQALLGRLIQKRFPRYYKYFSTESFVYHGEAMRNHNHLLGSIEGVDGIKSGFTRASGFNLVTSVHRDGHYVIAVVMGGRSSLERDAHMRELISAHIKETALKSGVPAIAKNNRHDETRPGLANAPVSSQGEPVDPKQPLLANTFPAMPVQSSSLAPTPALAPVAPAAPKPSAQVAARWLPPTRPDDAPMTAPATTVIEKNTLPLSHGAPTVPNQPRLVKTITIQTTPVPASATAAPPDDAPVASNSAPIDPTQPRLVKSITFQAMPAQLSSLASTPALVPVGAAAPEPSVQVAARLPPVPPADAPMAARGNPSDTNQPLTVKTISQTRPVQSASLTPVLVPVAAAVPEPSAQVAARWLPPAPPADQSRTVVVSAEPMPIAHTPAQTPPSFSEPAKLEPEKTEAAKLAGVRVELAKVESGGAPVKSRIAASAPNAPPHAHSGWLIQIGAFDREDEARQHLSAARLKVRDVLAAAHQLTERVQKGDKVLYRARFTELDKETAETACQRLRRSDMDCIALKN